MTEYTQFYGFSENPFDILPDPKFFFSAESHSEALASLLYGINQRKGFILILGEAGIGKTTLIHHLINILSAKVKIAFIPQSQIPYEQLLREILLKLEVPLRLEIKGSMLHELYYHLIRCLERDENVAIIIDEAHNISLDVIEEVRLLANLETSTSKLLQIVLVGQPELREKLRSEVIRQIKQRIVISCQISPLTEKESLKYIDHRLKIVGSSSSEVFTDRALSLICRYAKGTPLALNILCNNALFVGYGLSENKITASTVRKVRKEVDALSRERAQILISRIKRQLPRKIVYAFLTLTILVMVIFFGKEYEKLILNPQESKKLIERSVFKNKVKHHAVVEDVPITPSPEIMSSPPKISQTPVSSPTAISYSDTEIRVKKIVEVKAGANLSLLALKYYNESNTTLIDHILEFNPAITNPNLILVNQKIKIPEIKESLLIKPSSDGVFKIHLGTFLNNEDAIRYSHNIVLREKEIEIIPVKVSTTQTWYRVLAKPFFNRDEGLKVIKEMKQKELLPSFRRRYRSQY
jgi:type II secretory pathway predicted ATPase ExeA